MNTSNYEFENMRNNSFIKYIKEFGIGDIKNMELINIIWLRKKIS